jgi:hypothetical protein
MKAIKKEQRFRTDLALEAYRLFVEQTATSTTEKQAKEFCDVWYGSPSDLLRYLISFHHDRKPFSNDPTKRAAFLEFEQTMMVLYLEEHGVEDGAWDEILDFLRATERELEALKATDSSKKGKS